MSHRVLVVEDDEAMAVALRDGFDYEGYEVVVARDGEAGLAMARSADPDLIILDAMLPKRSGFLVLEKLRAMPKEERPKVVMISGNAGKRHQEGAASLGAVAFLNKPFRMDRLRETVEGILA